MPKSFVKHEVIKLSKGPGPGKYKADGISKDGKFILAKFKNSPKVLVPQRK